MAIASAPSSTGSSRPGAAISAFSTVQLASAFGPSFPFDLVAVVLVVFAAVVFLLLRDRPDRPVPTGSVLAPLVATLRMPEALQRSSANHNAISDSLGQLVYCGY